MDTRRRILARTRSYLAVDYVQFDSKWRSRVSGAHEGRVCGVGRVQASLCVCTFV